MPLLLPVLLLLPVRLVGASAGAAAPCTQKLAAFTRPVNTACSANIAKPPLLLPLLCLLLLLLAVVMILAGSLLPSAEAVACSNRC